MKPQRGKGAKEGQIVENPIPARNRRKTKPRRESPQTQPRQKWIVAPGDRSDSEEARGNNAALHKASGTPPRTNSRQPRQ